MKGQVSSTAIMMYKALWCVMVPYGVVYLQCAILRGASNCYETRGGRAVF